MRRYSTVTSFASKILFLDCVQNVGQRLERFIYFLFADCFERSSFFVICC
jgi:hypothetical protein